MPRREDDVTGRPGSVETRTLVLAGGFVLAVLATLAVFLTDNPQYLRIAVVGAAWAFVLAAFAAGRRGSDRVAAAARENELRRAYEFELEREVAARREYELELENEVRRETEDAVRYELDALRGDIAALSGLRDEVARVSEMRGDLAALAALREEVARVSALRDDVASLASLRQELGQLAELRADMGRLRAELTEQLSSEMLVERIVMRTQASRLPAEQNRLDTPGRSLESPATWADDTPPRELTGGWPAIRLDEPRETQQFQQVRAERPWSDGSWSAGSWTSPSVSPSVSPPVSPPPVPETATFAVLPPPEPTAPEPAFDLFGPLPAPASSREHRSRHAAAEQPEAPRTTVSPVSPPPVTPPVPAPSPLEWLSARELLDPPPPVLPASPGTDVSARPSPRPRPRPAGTRSLPEVPPRRRRTGETVAGPATTANPLAATPPPARAERPPVPPTTDRPAQAPLVTGPSTGSRLDQILAENGVSPAPGGRRRRRYREADEPDDVLARVLRDN
ncbi:MAG TPA: DUF6779 domain-containing protein [Blastococcus sp.]|jgi:hypothetical protein|nr:DUF6779 domain-containing protein [Blastococcus sp.]